MYGDLSALQVARTNLANQRYALLQPIPALGRRVFRAQIDESPNWLIGIALCAQRTSQRFAGGNHVPSLCLAAHDRHNHDLVRGEARRQPETVIIPMNHDRRPDEAGRKTPGCCVWDLQLPIPIDELLPLPEPKPGLSSHYRPVGAKPGGAWVRWLEPADLSDQEAEIYPAGRPAANIMKAMSLVPDEVKSFFDIVSHQYQGPLEMRDFSREYRAICHAQIELLAARVSALNQCLY